MRPHSLPLSYWNFIVRTGPIHKTALTAVRRNVRGRPIDLLAVNEYLRSYGAEGVQKMTSVYPSQVIDVPLDHIPLKVLLSPPSLHVQ